MTRRSVQPIYLIVDTSGSTLRSNWIEACNSTLPRVVEVLEERQGQRPDIVDRLCILTYATTATLQIGLMDVTEIQTLPALVPGGFSSFAAALNMLSDVVQADTAQIRSDGLFHENPLAMVVMHGLPTDSTGDILAARADKEERAKSTCLHVVCPVGTEQLTLMGLGFHRLDFVEEADATKLLAATVVNALVGDESEQQSDVDIAVISERSCDKE